MPGGLVFALLAIGLAYWLPRGGCWARVHGDSMRPTLMEGDLVIGVRVAGPPVLRAAIRRWALARDAIVVAEPSLAGQLQVKRVGGVAGDIHCWLSTRGTMEAARVPHEHVFLVSDARSQLGLRPAIDSRVYGPCPAERIAARIVVRIPSRSRPIRQ